MSKSAFTQTLNPTFKNFDPHSVPSPCFVVDKVAIENNLKILHQVQEASGAKILAALKAFSCWELAPLYQHYLSGTCASGYNEAKLGHDYYGGETHVFSAAFKKQELEKVLNFAHHVVFNSQSQWQRFQPLLQKAKEDRPELSFGFRINPEHSEGTVPIYDPCAPGSRLGIIREQFDLQQLEGIEGLHFHTLCEQAFAPLERTLDAVEKHWGDILPQMKWVNFGGGHHITAKDYDRQGLIERIKAFRKKYNVEVYLEPGEAIAIHTGVLVSEVLDITYNQLPQAILDTSATCHMPDTLEMPYRPQITFGFAPNEKQHTYRLGGMTCLAGDVMGDWSFDEPLTIGQRLVFEDMSHYTMVKTTTFNGINLPSIAIWNSDTNSIESVRDFGYEDFKNRLA